jgi:hypothetical protein
MSGVDVNAFLISMAVGEDIESIESHNRDICAILGFFDFKEGKVRDIVGLEELRLLENVVDIHLDVKAGEVIRPFSDDRSRHGYLIAYKQNENELRSFVEGVRNSVEVLYE